MDLSYFAQASILAGAATALTTEVLKSQYIPVPAQSHKRLTAAVVSGATALYSVYQYNLSHQIAMTWQAFLALGVLTMLVAATTYNHVIKGA